jgi:hypothetical protein
MEAVRRALVVAPVAALVAVGAPGVLRPGALGAVDPPWNPPPCPPGSAASGTPAWYRLDARLDEAGTLAGQRLHVGPLAGGAERAIDLPAESFSSGPVHGLVLAGDDDGQRSRLRIMDVGAGCAVDAGTSEDVIRSAILDADGRTVIEHRVDRSSRADLGVWARPAAADVAARLLPPPAADAAYGRTFSTDLAFADDGRLVVASCGELACRTRILDRRTGHVDRVDRSGPVIGVAGGRVVAWSVCPGLPCSIDAIDPNTGQRRHLVDGDGPAALGSGVLVAVTRSGLRLVDVRTGATHATPVADGLPIRGGSKAASGADLGAGEVLLAPDGRLALPAATRLDPVTGSSAGLGGTDR